MRKTDEITIIKAKEDTIEISELMKMLDKLKADFPNSVIILKNV